MSRILHALSTLTDRYQTTIPEPVRQALHLGKRDKIGYTIDNSGKVFLERADEDDPVLDQFLTFLVNDMKHHPEHIQPLNAALFERASALISGVEVDLDSPLNDRDE